MSETPDGVVLRVTSNDADARRQILGRALLQSTQGNRWPFPEHTTLHGGPGTIGHCPVIHADTHVTVQEIPDGVQIHVAARSASAVVRLQQATKARVRALAPASS